MKTRSIVISFIILLLVQFQYGCKKEDKDKDQPITTTDLSPQINILKPDSNNFTLDFGESFKLSVVASSNTNSNAALNYFKIEKEDNNGIFTSLIDTALNSDHFILNDLSCQAEEETGVNKWHVSVKDINEYSANEILTINVKKLSPNLHFLEGEYEPGKNRISKDTTLYTATIIGFGFEASSSTDKNLSKLTITRNFENVDLNTIYDTSFSLQNFSMDIETVSHPSPGSEYFEITVINESDKSSKIGFTIITEPTDAGIHIYNDIEMGSFSSPTNGLFASNTGETYALSEVNSDPGIQAKISWIYFQGMISGHTLMSPANETIVEIYPAIDSWTYRNTTHMGKTNISPMSFDQINNKNQLIITIQNSGVMLNEDFFSELQSSPGGFEVDDVIAFETNEGKRGLIKITQVNSAPYIGESTIKYDLKIEK